MYRQLPRSEQEQALRPPDSQLEHILVVIEEHLCGLLWPRRGDGLVRKSQAGTATCAVVSPPASQVPSVTRGMSPTAPLLPSPHLSERRGQRLLRGRNRKPVLTDKQAARPEQGMAVPSMDVFILCGVWFGWELARGAMEKH